MKKIIIKSPNTYLEMNLQSMAMALFSCGVFSWSQKKIIDAVSREGSFYLLLLLLSIYFIINNPSLKIYTLYHITFNFYHFILSH